MTEKELRDFLYQEIPLALAMGVDVQKAGTNCVEVSAPLALNRNHLETAFGGSLNSLLILSCYAWLFHRMSNEGEKCHVLIQAGHTDYILPVKEDLKAICEAPDEKSFQDFLHLFKRKGIGRIKLAATIKIKGAVACKFEGEFVAQKATSGE